MIKLLTIIGARPQIIKTAALSRAIKNAFADKIEEKILHTGQHYDANMSQVFFDELGIPAPDYNLHVGSAMHGEQTAKMLVGIEQILLSEHFDALVVYGDTNSTLAGAMAAAKLHVPVVHIEAGLRSYNRAMPEEINRITCDHLSNLLFAPTQTAVDNLRHEGFENTKARFIKGNGVQFWLSGDIMYDNSIFFAQMANKCKILHDSGLHENDYVMATIHRDNNTDQPERLTAIFKALLRIAQTRIVALPLHPRTAKLLEHNLLPEVYDQLNRTDNIRLLPPASFLDMIALEQNADLILTDSGGVQKESYFFKKPCVILRPETEWVEIVNQGAGILVDADEKRIVEAYELLSGKTIEFPPIFGNGCAAEFMLEKILDYLA